MSSPVIKLNTVAQPLARLVSITHGVGASPSRCEFEYPRSWSDANPCTYGDLIEVYIGGGRIFYGHVYDLDPADISNNHDAVHYVAFDLRQAMKTIVIGDPYKYREDRQGYDVFFNQDNLDNKSVTAVSPYEFQPYTMDAGACEFWTFATALTHIFNKWLSSLGIGYSEATFALLSAHSTERVPPVSVMGMDGLAAVDAIVNLWGFGTWMIDPSSLSFKALCVTDPTTTVRTITHFDKDNATNPAVVTDWSAMNTSIHQNLSATFNNSSVISGRIIQEEYYYFRQPTPIVGDLLQLKAVPAGGYFTLIIDPTQYEANVLGDNLDSTAYGKPVLQNRITAPEDEPLSVHEFLRVSINAGVTWLTVPHTVCDFGYDPFSITIPYSWTDPDTNAIVTLYNPAGVRQHDYIIRIPVPTIIEDRLYSSGGLGSAALAPRRLIVREDLVPLDGLNYNNTSDIQNDLDLIKARAGEFEGKRMVRSQSTLRNIVALSLGDRIDFGGTRTLDTAGWALFAVSIVYHGMEHEHTEIHACNVLGEPSNYIANAVSKEIETREH